MGINKIICGDCLEVMLNIPDKSIDMILCDLPYGTTACKWDAIIPFKPLWEQYKRIIKNGGAIVLTASQPFTTDLINSNRGWFKYEWIWYKFQPTGNFLVKLQPMKIHENIIIFSENKTKYNPQMENRSTNSHSDNKGGIYKYNSENFKHKITINKPKGKYIYPNSVKFINAVPRPNRLHPTQKPVTLFEYLIKTYTNKGDLVLDNCAGSGTTGVACKNLGRNYILIEKEKKYVEIAKKRIKAIPELLF